eukprot:TRINITY_DN7084_c1_g1_i3.p1 TRINITY_DN7084_c1_g1~~TRINITY_DN7084_c1_g1_i3.p1  ORF type:complete len:305 (+),score=37.28 TRINITY_DN7084_c1_g1_i3:149-1063(+)
MADPGSEMDPKVDGHEPNSPSSASSCRVCHLSPAQAEDEPLIEPCVCTGSVRFIHRSCLDRWRHQNLGSSVANVLRCELCSFAYAYEFRRARPMEAMRTLTLSVIYVSLPLLLIGGLISVATELVVGIVVVFAVLGIWALVDLSMAALKCPSGITCQALQQLCSFEEEEPRFPVTFGKGAKRPAMLMGNTFDGPDGCNVFSTLRSWCSCREIVFLLPLALPHVITAALFLLRSVLGLDGLELLGKCLAIFGAMYSACVLALQLLVAWFRPPWMTKVDSSGLPLVRSLTPEERRCVSNCEKASQQ